MIFALLVLLAAFLIEGIGTYVSVVGLSALFAQNPVIIILAVALDIGKIVSVSFLYKYWKKVNLLMKTYMTIAAIVLMIITSTGCFGYLSGQFQKAISGTNQDTILVQSLESEQGKLQLRKQEIDAQIAKLPDNFVKGRKQLMQQFQPEEDRINSRLAEIDKQLPQLKIESVKKNVDVGPIVYVAQAFNTDPEHAVKWVILIIIFVFDPLAIALLLAGNFLLAEREKKIDADTYRDESGYVKLDSVGNPLKEASPLPGKTLGFEDDLEYFNKPMVSHPLPASYTPPVTPPVEPTPPEFRKIADGDLPIAVQPEEHPFVEAMLDHQEHDSKFRLDLSDQELHEHLGRERYQEPSEDQLDHITHEDLGRQKPIDEEPPEQTESQPPVTTNRVLPSGAKRETHTLDQLGKIRAKLEDGPNKHDVTMTGVQVR